MKNKENALNDFIMMIRKSWTYSRLTPEEITRLESDALRGLPLYGNYKQRYDQLHGVYYAFLLGLNYNPLTWRKEPATPQF